MTFADARARRMLQELAVPEPELPGRRRVYDRLDSLSLGTALQAAERYRGTPEYAAFFEWLDRQMATASDSFRGRDLPPPVRAWCDLMSGIDRGASR